MKDNISAFDAAEYDHEIKRTIPYYEDFYKQVVEVAKVQFENPVKWLDVGCGTGKMAEAAFENFAPYSEAGRELYLKRWKAFQIAQGQSITESEKHIERYGKNYFPVTISEQVDVLRQCGFGTVEILWVSNMQVGLLGIK